MRNKISGQNENGFTLVEIAISTGLMATVLAMGLFVLIRTQQLTGESRQKLLALNALRSTLEEIKNTGLSSVGSIDTTDFIPEELTNGVLSITTSPSNLTTATLATITLQIQWNDLQGRLQTMEVTTMRSRY